ncbi:GPI ethanolamine phosphate transferase 3 isoform X2 [Senna tora]|uniref:GPI ethanolamine phosphate transferase 3 isoform X2 n=1 Tax=Senna tora TaxID=362788 RepID=A0A834TQD5_9FABA|nr:GPI ethanolamine phosphate transferase 3 isoform X2 [Senna tora]
MGRDMGSQRKNRSGKWEHIWPLWLTLLLHMLAIFLFTRGFLLTRTELPYYSNCSDVSQSPCFSSSSDGFFNRSTNYSDAPCWTKPAVNRLVIIVLDALRFDFVAPSSFFTESKPWMDKLQVLKKVASRNGSTAKIFKAFADPPTTSLQRLKGLTTGGLPTFVDVGNSFGAPAIVEDNLIHQLVQNGKKVVMMGDDTWTQLFPHHFERSYPYPSFNVKDLDTVDNGCIDHLIPSLYEEDWDVLIAHFLGVDHAGHIFGVDSTSMIAKLEQYNNILERVIEELESHSRPGGLHENTLLVVMGDHAQTLNGDHGGGSAEEVETAIFAMNFKKSPSLPPEFDTSSCRLDKFYKGSVCISSMQQLDFATTISALIGIPFPYGRCSVSILSMLLLYFSNIYIDDYFGLGYSDMVFERMQQRYICILWIGLWKLLTLALNKGGKVEIVEHECNKLLVLKALNHVHVLHSAFKPMHALNLEFSVYVISFLFLSIGRLPESNALQFAANLMKINLNVVHVCVCVSTLSLLYHTLVGFHQEQYDVSMSIFGGAGIFSLSTFAYVLLTIRACSFLSNSYIFFDLNFVVIMGEKLLGEATNNRSFRWPWKYVMQGTILCYMLIIVHWITDSSSALVPESIGRNYVPRIIYAISLGQLSLLTFGQLFKDKYLDCKESLVIKTIAMLSACSSTVILLSGKQGPMIALASIIGGYCILRMDNTEQGAKDGSNRSLAIDPFPVMQWSLFAVCLFFCSGHWCAFDGLRYGAAFVGFEEFMLVRQAILLAIDTFGFSVILPVLGLPLLVATKCQANKRKHFIFTQLSQVYIMYGLNTAFTTTFTILCVTVHRRHLMVWGLFAPKFVFDVAGLVLTDVLTCLASLYYFDQVKDNPKA